MIANSDHLAINLNSGVQSKFHWIWLRDSCLCSGCMNRNAKQKYNDSATIALDIQPKSIDQQGDIVKIVWDDGHESEFSTQWMIENDYSVLSEPAPALPTPRKLGWKPWQSYADIENAHFSLSKNNTDYRSIIEYLFQYGFVILKNDASQPVSYEEICDNMSGFTDRSYFGDFFDLEVKPDDVTDSISFSKNPLPLHTDIPYYTTTPDYQFLFGLEVAGTPTSDLIGKTMFVDGVAVANQMKESAPEDYEVLTKTKVTYRAAYPMANKVYKNATEIIKLNDQGEIVQLLNNPSKMFFENIPFDQMGPLYKAYQNFKNRLHNGSVSHSHTWEQGDMIVFDNRRIFHGREAFHDNNITRKLRGGYMREVELAARHAFLSLNQ